MRETIPVTGSGEMVLLYPKWIPGGHSPRNEVDKVVGLHVSAGAGTSPYAPIRLFCRPEATLLTLLPKAS